MKFNYLKFVHTGWAKYKQTHVVLYIIYGIKKYNHFLIYSLCFCTCDTNNLLLLLCKIEYSAELVFE